MAGRLDEARLRAALDEALRRHPLSRARKASSQRWGNYHVWETPPQLDRDPLRVTDHPDDAVSAAARAKLYSTSIPLAQSPPLRPELARHGEGELFMLNLSHAATDGIGALRLLHSIARAYTGADDPLPEMDYLAARDLMGSHAAADPKSRARRYLAVAGRLRELLFPPARLARLGGREEPGYRFHHVRLSAAETRRLTDLEHAGDRNDVLLAALHLAVGAGKPARISTTARQRTSAAAALAAVTAQTSRKHHSGMGTSLLELLSWSWLLPLWGKRAAINLLDHRFTDTALLSDLGRIEDPPSFGDDAGETVELWFSPPARMPLGVAVGTVVVADRLHLAFRSRRAQFGADAARRFAQCYLDQLRCLIAQIEDGGRREPGSPAR